MGKRGNTNMTTTFKPLGKRVLIKEHELPVEKKSLLIMPDSHKPKERLGKVIAPGKEVTNLNVDDIVLLDKYGGQEVNLDDQKYFVLNEESILGIVSQGLTPT
jgi:chaperonin GroES